MVSKVRLRRLKYIPKILTKINCCEVWFFYYEDQNIPLPFLTISVIFSTRG